jgi:septum formation protein
MASSTNNTAGAATELRDLILASASPRRAEILRSLGLRIEIVPSVYEEIDPPGRSVEELARLHATEKALEVARRFPDRLVVGADTLVELNGRALGKPAGVREAQAMLRALSGREHLVHSAVCTVAPEPSRRHTFAATTQVWFYPLSDEDISAYVATGEPLDKAGAYGIQGRGATLVERIEGDFYTVMGFPLARFVRSLHHVGLRWSLRAAAPGGAP